MYIRNPFDEAARSCVSGSTSLECDALMIFDVRPRNFCMDVLTACRNVSRERKRETINLFYLSTHQFINWKWWLGKRYGISTAAISRISERSGMFHIIFRLRHEFTSASLPAAKGFFAQQLREQRWEHPGMNGWKNFMERRKFAEDFLKNRVPIQEDLRVFLEKWV